MLIAIVWGHKDVVNTLLNAGVDHIYTASSDSTLLHLAAQKHHPEVVEILLNIGMHPNATDYSGDTPLLCACAADKRTVEILLNAKADVNTVDQFDHTPLHRAARFGNESVTKILIEAGADIRATNKDGKTPLHWATKCKESNEEVVNILLKANVNPNVVSDLVFQQDKYGYTALHYAAARGCINEVKVLIKQFPDLAFVKDNKNRIALDLAIHSNHSYIIESLQNIKTKREFINSER